MMKRLAALGVAALLILAGWTALEIRRPYRGCPGKVIVEIDPGTRAPDVATMLVERGVLAHRLPFIVLHGLARLRRQHLRAGEYLFDRAFRPIEVYRKIAHGDVYLHTVLIPEGSDRFEIARILHRDLGIDAATFLRVTQQTELVQDLDPQAPSLEGYLFPDTYRFPKGVTAQGAALAMLERFRHILAADFRQTLDQPGQSPARLHEAIILASLVEKETSQPAERALIAGVFERRLESRWPLECDPTVVYAARLEGDPDTPAGPITRAELGADSPYNTYRHAGLPSGPICSPGAASIRAALNPAGGDSLYFVSNNHGGHVFARTLEEHQRNVARYRRELAALQKPENAAYADRLRTAETKRERSGRRRAGPSRARQKVVHHAKQERSDT